MSTAVGVSGHLDCGGEAGGQLLVLICGQPTASGSTVLITPLTGLGRNVRG